MIRLYTKKDREAVLSLIRLNIPDFFAIKEEADLATYLDDKLEDYFVFEKNGQLVGSGGINYFPETKTARISWDIIHPDFQGQAIGSQLTKHRIAWIKSKATFKVIIVRTSQLAYRFYEKMGFVLEKTESDFWAEGLDLYQMRMEL